MKISKTVVRRLIKEAFKETLKTRLSQKELETIKNQDDSELEDLDLSDAQDLQQPSSNMSRRNFVKGAVGVGALAAAYGISDIGLSGSESVDLKSILEAYGYHELVENRTDNEYDYIEQWERKDSLHGIEMFFRVTYFETRSASFDFDENNAINNIDILATINAKDDSLDMKSVAKDGFKDAESAAEWLETDGIDEFSIEIDDPLNAKNSDYKILTNRRIDKTKEDLRKYIEKFLRHDAGFVSAPFRIIEVGDMGGSGGGNYPMYEYDYQKDKITVVSEDVGEIAHDYIQDYDLESQHLPSNTYVFDSYYGLHGHGVTPTSKDDVDY